MHSERDVTRSVRSWLRTDEHESADRLLGTVLALLDTTPQRRSSWPSVRITEMNNVVKVALAAAAVVAVALVGTNLQPAGGRVGGSGSVASPSPSSTPLSSPSPTPAAVFPPQGELAIGRHPLTVDGVPLSLSVPAGWYSNGRPSIGADDEVLPEGGALVLWSPANVYATPCAQTPLSPPVGPSIAELADAMSTIPGTELVSAPSDVTVGGHAAKYLAYIVPEDVGCVASEFYLAYSETPDDPCAGTEPCGRHATALGDTVQVWIVDVDGVRIVIEGDTTRNASSAIEQEIQQIVDSIQFE